MITGDVKSKVDRLWDAFWSGGISNPLEVIEQITYLLFIRRLDELEAREEDRATITGEPMRRRLFDPALGQEKLRWSELKGLAPASMHAAMGDAVFPFLRRLGSQVAGGEGTYAAHMRDARYTIPSPALLAKVVDMVDALPMDDRDTAGDL
ncbi:hypothetical protein USB125703_00769 [Pseudoclavibacter triregionum]|nr:hypothetical protein USB125703_00769 [Pseudoclavibacter triregionum]